MATKAGRRADPHVPEASTLEALRGWTDRSRRDLGVDRLDLVSCTARRGGRRPPGRGAAGQLALRWLLDQPGVTTVIPGARNAGQARAKAAAADLPPLDQRTHEGLREVYDRRVREHVHDRW